METRPGALNERTQKLLREPRIRLFAANNPQPSTRNYPLRPRGMDDANHPESNKIE
jgi:hypothetical protein